VSAKRRWYQIHLSTALIAMLCIGALLGLNITPGMVDDYIEPRPGYGWPLAFYLIPSLRAQTSHFWPWPFYFDVFCWVTCLFLAVYIGEGLIRWREARKRPVQ